MPIYPNIYQTLLPGPIVELRGYLAACGLRGRLYAYLNYNGPTGTARDELAEGMLALALERGALTPGQTIVEAVSGPFATALTLAGLTAGHPVTLVMPEDAPAMRQESLLRLGAQIIHTPAQAGLAGARALAKATAAEKGWYYMDWLNNDDNPTYHRRVTGPALVRSIAREGSSIVSTILYKRLIICATTAGMASRARRRGIFSVSIACVFDLSFISIRSFLISMF